MDPENSDRGTKETAVECRPRTPKTECNIRSKDGWSFFLTTQEQRGAVVPRPPPPSPKSTPEQGCSRQRLAVPINLKNPVVGHGPFFFLFFLSFWTESKYGLMIKFFGKCSFESILLCLRLG